MNKEELRKAFEAAYFDYQEWPEKSDLTRLDDGYYLGVVQWQWQSYQAAWQARQPEIDQLKADNERLFNVIKQAQVLAGGSERDNAHDMDQQLCEIWLLCDECEQGEK